MEEDRGHRSKPQNNSTAWISQARSNVSRKKKDDDSSSSSSSVTTSISPRDLKNYPPLLRKDYKFPLSSQVKEDESKQKSSTTIVRPSKNILFRVQTSETKNPEPEPFSSIKEYVTKPASATTIKTVPYTSGRDYVANCPPSAVQPPVVTPRNQPPVCQPSAVRPLGQVPVASYPPMFPGYPPPMMNMPGYPPFPYFPQPPGYMYPPMFPGYPMPAMPPGPNYPNYPPAPVIYPAGGYLPHPPTASHQPRPSVPRPPAASSSEETSVTLRLPSKNIDVQFIKAAAERLSSQPSHTDGLRIGDMAVSNKTKENAESVSKDVKFTSQTIDLEDTGGEKSKLKRRKSREVEGQFYVAPGYRKLQDRSKSRERTTESLTPEPGGETPNQPEDAEEANVCVESSSGKEVKDQEGEEVPKGKQEAREVGSSHTVDPKNKKPTRKFNNRSKSREPEGRSETTAYSSRNQYQDRQDCAPRTREYEDRPQTRTSGDRYKPTRGDDKRGREFFRGHKNRKQENNNNHGLERGHENGRPSSADLRRSSSRPSSQEKIGDHSKPGSSVQTLTKNRENSVDEKQKFKQRNKENQDNNSEKKENQLEKKKQKRKQQRNKQRQMKEEIPVNEDKSNEEMALKLRFKKQEKPPFRNPNTTKQVKEEEVNKVLPYTLSVGQHYSKTDGPAHSRQSKTYLNSRKTCHVADKGGSAHGRLEADQRGSTRGRLEADQRGSTRGRLEARQRGYSEHVRPQIIETTYTTEETWSDSEYEEAGVAQTGQECSESASTCQVTQKCSQSDYTSCEEDEDLSVGTTTVENFCNSSQEFSSTPQVYTPKFSYQNNRHARKQLPPPPGFIDSDNTYHVSVEQATGYEEHEDIPSLLNIDPAIVLYQKPPTLNIPPGFSPRPQVIAPPGFEVKVVESAQSEAALHQPKSEVISEEAVQSEGTCLQQDEESKSAVPRDDDVKVEVFDYWDCTLKYEDKKIEQQKAREVSDEKCDFILEVTDDLFLAPPTRSLVHCVAEDMLMGQGIAIEFRRRFNRVGELLNQRCKTGEVAVLDDPPGKPQRFLYYLVTKNYSSSKPLLSSLEQSLLALKEHCLRHGVNNLAMPLIGCGRDQLAWRDVLQCLTRIFQDSGVHIKVYKLDKNWEEEPGTSYLTHRDHVECSLADLEANTARVFLTSQTGEVDSTMSDLDTKFHFLQDFKKSTLNKSEVYRYESKYPKEVVYGLVVREKDGKIDYQALESSCKALSKMLAKDEYSHLGLQGFFDPNDSVVMEKIITIMKWTLGRNCKNPVTLHTCYPTSVLKLRNNQDNTA